MSKSEENKLNFEKSNMYDYIQLLGLARKYDMNEYEYKLILGIVYDYLDNNWRW